MKKIFAFISCILIALLFVSCSGKKGADDTSALKTQLAQDWLLKDHFDDGNPIEALYSDPLKPSTFNGSGNDPEKDLISVRLPKDEYINSMVRTHSVDLSKKLTESGSVNSLYGVMNGSIPAVSADILAIVNAKKAEIESKITVVKDAMVQTEWSVAVDVEEASNQVFYAAYLPLAFTYSGTDETPGIYSFIFVPIKVAVAKYEEKDGVRTYNNDFVTNTQNLRVEWKSYRNVIQSDIIK